MDGDNSDDNNNSNNSNKTDDNDDNPQYTRNQTDSLKDFYHFQRVSKWTHKSLNLSPLIRWNYSKEPQDIHYSTYIKWVHKVRFLHV